MQPDGVDIRVSWSVGIEFGGTTQFAECLFASFQPSERGSGGNAIRRVEGKASW